MALGEPQLLTAHREQPGVSGRVVVGVRCRQLEPDVFQIPTEGLRELPGDLGTKATEVGGLREVEIEVIEILPP